MGATLLAGERGEVVSLWNFDVFSWGKELFPPETRPCGICVYTW